MKQIFLTIVIAFFLVNSGFGQNSQIKRTSHWFFGDKAGLDFSSGSPVADTNGQMSIYAGCSTMSDTAGNLLMYTDGRNVWNKNHQIMPNGTDLFGTGTPVQSSVIVPKPLNDDIYYIFTTTGIDGIQYGMCYSIVDMTLNGGLGDVTIKNELLYKPSSEQLGATMHANCQDVWIMGHEANSNVYRAYLLTENGIDTNQVVKNDIGNYPKEYNHGQGLKFSPNGKKMVASNFWNNFAFPTFLDTLDLLDFDNSIGILSNLIKLADTTIVAFNFSPNSKRLYVNCFNTQLANQNVIPGANNIYQYNLEVNNELTILNSKTSIHQSQGDYDFTGLEHGLDGKIYAVNPSQFFHDSISEITFPNELGLACLAREFTVSLDGRTSQTQLPNFLSSFFNQDEENGCFTTTNISEIQNLFESIMLYPNPFTYGTTLEFEMNKNLSNIDFLVFDITGRIVKQINSSDILHKGKFKEIIINLEKEKAGVYFLNIKYLNSTKIIKLIKN